MPHRDAVVVCPQRATPQSYKRCSLRRCIQGALFPTFVIVFLTLLTFSPTVCSSLLHLKDYRACHTPFLHIPFPLSTLPMPRDMSYRKPVPIYIPSPPSSPPLPPPMRLSLTLGSGADDHMPPLPNDWRDIIEQALVDGSDTFFMSDEVLIGRPVRQELLQESQTPSISHYSGHQMWNEYRSATRSATFSPANSGSSRPHKRKLPQHYRPPTPPLPTHYNKRSLPDNELQRFSTHLPCVASGHVQERRNPPPRRELSTKAGSFSTIWTKSPSFRTENTYSSFGNSEPSVLFSGSFTTYAGLGTGLPVLPRQFGRGETTVQSNSTRSFISSWRGNLGSWSTSLKMKLRSFTRRCIC